MTEGVHISAVAYRIDDADRPILNQAAYSKRTITIGNHICINKGAIQRNAINAANGLVNGAGALVTPDAPAHAVAAAVSLHVIRILD